MKQNLLIIGGILLVIGSMVGLFSDQPQPSAVSADGMYIGPMKPLATPTTRSSEENRGATLNFSPTETIPVSTPTVGLIDRNAPKVYSVHADVKDPLESPTIPDRIVIPAIDLDAPVVSADFNTLQLEGETFGQWQAPNIYAAGWHPNSALLGKRGNTVINGHHNEYGEVFGRLVDLKVGDIVEVYSRDQKFTFIIANRMILPERFQPLSVRLENARWINATDDVRLTLITCWPKQTNTHRLILVARPVASR